ncbi:cadherin-like beta sandwich domain-containing protein [Paenibacillus sp. WST5]|uniref:Cadherin-like beta sandwich domain-containing protein n=2 Tax=Paenibacillus sedimenti TaxID=2770274 RepID=A0A926KKT6_9BACL|nr:cadherin-like beta sandwich domain-containing protein [Paenibacillus sedimenti]
MLLCSLFPFGLIASAEQGRDALNQSTVTKATYTALDVTAQSPGVEVGELSNQTVIDEVYSNLPLLPVIAGGAYHSIALADDGTVWTWGENSSGQLGNGTLDNSNKPIQVNELNEIIAVSGEKSHSLALMQNGTVWAWGSNLYGELGDGTRTDKYTPVQVEDLSDVIEIAGGGYYSIALKIDGTVWTWGRNYGESQSGAETTTVPVQVPGLDNVIAIAAGDYHSMALKNDGTVWTWGANNEGRLGDGTIKNKQNPVQVSGLGDMAAIAGGGYHSMALKKDGTVWTWGSNSYGQLGDDTFEDKKIPVQVDLHNAIAIAAGSQHSVALTKDGTVWAWGDNTYDQLGEGAPYLRDDQPVQVTGLNDVTAIASGGFHSIALNTAGTIMAWGNNEAGQLGDGTTTNRSIPVQISDLITTDASNADLSGLTLSQGLLNPTFAADKTSYSAVVANEVSALTVTATAADSEATVTVNEAAASSGQASNPVSLNVGANTIQVIVTAQDDITTKIYTIEVSRAAGASLLPKSVIAGGVEHSIALKKDGTVWSWGDNEYNQLGDGTTIDRLTPVQVSGLTGVASVAAGRYLAIALKNDGTLWSWGANGFGSLGSGGAEDRSVPGEVAGISGVSAVATGGFHAIALKNDGSIWTWGLNARGQLGDGTTTTRFSPVPVAGLNGVTAIEGGFEHTVALKSDGTVWAWGANLSGQLGNGTTANSLTPVQVPGLSGVIAIASGDYHSFALKSDGTLWAWGGNGRGQLGDGTTIDRRSPVQVGGITGVKAIAGGSFQTIALKNDGTVWMWGMNDKGQLGDGTLTDRLTPVQIPGLSGVTTIASGEKHSIAVKSNGTIWTWGWNEAGQLGDGSTIDRITPVQVQGLGAADANLVGITLSQGTLSPAFASSITSYSASVPNYVDRLTVTTAAADVTATVHINDVAVINGQPQTQIRLGVGDNIIRIVVNSQNGAATKTYTIIVSRRALNGLMIASGGSHTIATKSDGSVWTWGNNSSGQLGDGTNTNRDFPVKVYGVDEVKAIAGGLGHTVVLKGDGTVWTWGDNNRGELGDNTNTNRNIPVQVTNLTGVKAIASGGEHTLALMNDGGVRTWGLNVYGQLGNGISGTDSNGPRINKTPTSVWNKDRDSAGTLVPFSEVSAIAAGGNHSIALKGGMAWTWGHNAYGQLGDGTNTSKAYPVPITSLNCSYPIDGCFAVTAIAGGANHTIALRSDGTVWTWGRNDSGQLGSGSTDKNYPSIVADLDGVVAITGGSGHSVALKNDGTVLTWGNNSSGQLGDGTLTSRNRPVQVSGLSGVVAIAGGALHTVALKNDGTIWAWGTNAASQLGNRSTVESSVPVQVHAFGFSQLTADLSSYNRGDDVTVHFRLKGFTSSDKINSATFKLEYDTGAFELASGNIQNDVVSGYIPAHIKTESVPGTITYVVADLSQDYPIANDTVLFSVHFKVKPNASIGSKTFRVYGTNVDLSTDMLDSSFKVYNVLPTSLEIDIVSGAKIDASVSLYLGDQNSSLNNLLLGKVKQNEINKIFENLTVTVKSSSSDPGVTYKGKTYWIQDANGNIAAKDGNNRVIGKLNITALPPISNAIVEIGGSGYLTKRVENVDLVAEQYNSLNTTAASPMELIPGDIGSIGRTNGNLMIHSDGIINNVDFSAWLKIFKEIQNANGAQADIMLADFTRDGVVNNEDFSLWTAAYRKVI